MVRSFLVRFVAFLVAVATMVLLGSTAHSLFVQQAWLDAATQSVAASAAAAPVEIATADRIAWVLHDLTGMQPLYGALITMALLFGLLIAGAVARFTGARLAVFAVGGAACIFTLFTILKLTLGTVGVFGARGLAGLGVQMLAGLIAAVVFAVMTQARRPAAAVLR